MTSSLRHRRWAERFAQLLDEATGGRRQRRRTPLDRELTELVTLGHQLLTASPAPEIDPEFRTGLRAMLTATVEREGVGQTARPEPALPGPRRALRAAGRPTIAVRFTRGPRARTAMVTGVAIGAVAFTGMSAASEHAVPGDTLYGMKRSSERAQLALTSSDVGRGYLYLGFARTRLAEARTLTSDLEPVLDDMDQHTGEGARLLTAAAADQPDLATLDAIEEFVAGQRTALADLSERVAGADQVRLAESLALLNAIERRAARFRQHLRDCGDQPAARSGAGSSTCARAGAGPDAQPDRLRPAG
jgi:hypothetical protein